ncbi:glucokinase [Methyloglobulus sp.]|uniref:glucokinase n=1 Tax=Methyloglobulus sp. TaxID=2518622 RepID=UPI0032B74A71
MLLVGDIGGTKTILALFKPSGRGWGCAKRTLYASADYKTFTELLAAFLLDVDAAISSVCIGVAGPVVNGDCAATNLPWILSRDEISRSVHAPNVWLLNDLEATAWGLLALPEDDFVELNPNAVQSQVGNIAVIAAGTGLGEALMIWDGATHRAIATEGGHADFAPSDQQQIGLLNHLMQKYDGHVSYERLLSGHGLVNIYDYLKQIQFAPVNISTENKMLTDDPAAVIGMAGVEGNDKLCVEALNLFCRIYGAESGNLALKCLPSAGVYLAGGIAGKIFPVLKNGEFMKGFLNKGRIKVVLENIPVKICINADVALLGALTFIEKMSG